MATCPRKSVMRSWAIPGENCTPLPIAGMLGRTRQKTLPLAQQLQQSACMHTRDSPAVIPLLSKTRGGTTRVLITTDVWARGLDVQQVRATVITAGCSGGRSRASRVWWC